MTTRTFPSPRDLPGFSSLFDLGFSDILNTFVQGIGRRDGWGYALRTDGTVWKWEARQVRVGTVYEPVRYVTKQLTSLEQVTQLAGDSGGPRFAVQADGTVWGWGEDLYDELGLDATDFDVPVQLPGLADVRSLQTVSLHGARLALTRDGHVWGWGSNHSGHLGDGTTTSRRDPSRIQGLDDISALVVTSRGRCLALNPTGEVWAWGNTGFGDASDDRLSPVRLVGLPPVRALFQDAATATDGSLWTWDDQLDPRPVPGLDDVALLVQVPTPWGQPATYHAVTNDGTVWGWGGNENGQIGDGTTVERAEPVAIDQLSDISDIVGRGAVRFAITHRGDIFGWGGVGYADSLGMVPHLMQLPRAHEAESFDKWGSTSPEPVGVSTSSAAAFFDLSGGKTFLMHWAAVGDVEQIQALIQEGADVNAVDHDGDTALFYALSNGHADVVDLLLDHGANPNISGKSGKPLHFAADQGWTGLVSSLVRHGADVDAQGSGGLTASMLAAGTGRTEALRVLSAAGADLDALDDDGDSALVYAASRGRVNAVRLLLQQGVNPSPRAGASGQTPLSIATILSRSNHPLPPGATRSDYGAIVGLLTTPRSRIARTGHASAPAPADPAPRPQDTSWWSEII